MANPLRKPWEDPTLDPLEMPHGMGANIGPATSLGFKAPGGIDPKVAAFVQRKIAPLTPSEEERQGPPSAGIPRETLQGIEPSKSEPSSDDKAPGTTLPEEEEIKRPPGRFMRMLDALGSGLAGQPFDRRYWNDIDRQYENRVKAREQRRQEAMLADPTSRQSQTSRSLYKPYLTAAGWSSEDIERLSAKDLQGFELQRATEFTAKHKQAIEERKAEEAKALREAEAKKAGELEKRSYDEKEWDRRNKETSKQALQRAHVLAGLREAGEINNQQFQERMAIIREDWERSRRDEAAARQEQHRTEDKTRQYSQDMDRTGIPQARTTIERLKANIRAAREKKGKVFDNEDSAKLYGNANNIPIARLPIVGNAAGEVISQYAASDLSAEDKAILQDLAKLRNLEIKDLSGSAVSASEGGRVAAAQGSGLGNNVEDWERWLDAVDQGLDTDELNILGGYGPEVKGQYDRNRGGVRKPQGQPSQGGAGKLTYVDPGSGVQREANDTPENRKKLEGAGVQFKVK